MTTREQMEANRAALERGEWVTGGPHQTRALVSVKAPGGVPVKVSKMVWRGRIFRRGADGKQEQEFCPHNHLKKTAAETCGQQAVRRKNKEAKQTEVPQ